jgi:hypothetical protein
LILIGNFTRNVQKYQLSVKLGQLELKIISKAFSTVVSFFYENKKPKGKNFTIGQIWGHFWKKTHFSLVFF